MIYTVHLDSTVLLHSWHWPSQTVLPQYHRIIPRGMHCLGAQGDVRGSFPDLTLTEVCSSFNPWSWVGRDCIFRLLLRPHEGEDSLFAKPRPWHCLGREQPVRPHCSAALALVSCSQLRHLLASCRMLTFWFNFIFHSRTITKKGTIRPRHLALAAPGARPLHSPGSSEGPLRAEVASPPASLDRAPCFCFSANQPFKTQILAIVSDAENHK